MIQQREVISTKESVHDLDWLLAVTNSDLLSARYKLKTLSANISSALLCEAI
jgi:hypothetical protein